MPKITDLTSFEGALSNTDVFPVVNSAITKKIPLSALRTNILSGSSVTSTALATEAVTTSKIQSLAVVNDKIAVGTIQPDRLATVAGLTAGAYGSVSAAPVITVNEKGLVTAVSTTPLRNQVSCTIVQPVNSFAFDLFRTTYAMTIATTVTATFAAGSGTATLSTPLAQNTVLAAGTKVTVTFTNLASGANNWTLSFGYTSS